MTQAPHHFLFGQSYLSWIPAWHTSGWLILVGLAVLSWIVLRLGWGKPVMGLCVGMLMIRGTVVALLLLILLGPTIVNEQPGSTKRAALTYLFDGSSSMQLGKEITRWDECWSLVDAAERAVGELKSSDTQAFRFGHRLLPLDKSSEPDASDSRLADALRQLLPLINPRDTAGVVLLSDGRVRATESVETLAKYFGELKIPIHVAPVGEAEGTGDVAIVSLVAAPESRKYTENEVQVFFRSFGFTGERTTIRLIDASGSGSTAEKTIASIPVTLSGGAQSAALTFRVDALPVDLIAAIDPLPGELTERNNRVTTHTEINRSKLRVLYVEGDSTQQSLLARVSQLFSFAPGTNAATTTTTLHDALEADQDIECVVLASVGGRARPTAISANSGVSIARFPLARSELFAYDCIVLSNVSPTALEEEDQQRLAQWVDGRGGGLIVCGSESLQPEDWSGSPLAAAIPIDFSTVQFTSIQDVAVKVLAPRHPIWRMHMEEQRSAALLNSIPAMSTGFRRVEARSNSEVLAATDDETPLPLLIAERYGRGRVLVSTADLAGPAMAKLATTWGDDPTLAVGKFWRNMVYWATEGSAVGRRRLVAESDKRFYRPGDQLGIFARAFDESARKTQGYRIYAMFEPVSLDDMSIYAPILWPENIVRDSGEVGPRIAWGEELLVPTHASGEGFQLDLQLSESTSEGDGGLRIELTAYEGDAGASAFGHGTQVDSTSLQIQILSDPFEQQNPLPNREFLARLASLSGGKVLTDARELADILGSRAEHQSPPARDLSPAWSRWWLWLTLIGLLTTEWIWRRMTGMA